MDTATRPVLCQLPSAGAESAALRGDQVNAPALASVSAPRLVKRLAGELSLEDGKIVLQPRLCTLRSYSSDRLSTAVIRTRRDSSGEASPFFETLSKYIESSKKSHDFEIISGRLAMVRLFVLPLLALFPILASKWLIIIIIGDT